MTERDLLISCRKALGYTSQGLALYLALSDDRQIRRWERGDKPIPSLLWLMFYWMLKWREKTPESEKMIDRIDDVLRHRRLGHGARNQRVGADD